ncbi:MAG: organoarsenical effux MFS transporter ArsJ [Pseudomonadales bacterium]|nr:organoarsenical effux MFS transporter ArsJ [Pseudomonadales bacterium]MCP5185687.1 organoarsenical effux MFS transporter ArsJ [Pseudomonadales bacterium]
MTAVAQRASGGYLTVTAGYWAFTLTDGAIRMLVVLYFHGLGYSPLAVAMLFLFYEFFGVVTNLTGGWLGARIGLNRTMNLGMALQVLALALLAAPSAWLTVPYVMTAQALSGIAKDLNKMSAKASVKLLAGDSESSRLLRYVSVLTGSKNALKGGGYFLGALLLDLLDFQGALLCLAGGLGVVLLATLVLLPSGLGRMRAKPRFRQIFSRRPAINWLAGARLFLFASRDVWFVVALPVFLHEVLGWTATRVGAFLAAWIIGYGVLQVLSPAVLQPRADSPPPGGQAARRWVLVLAVVPAAIALALGADVGAQWAVVGGLFLFGLIFAVNSALHSFLVLAYADADDVSMNVGFYYTANAAGRLFGTVLSGAMYQWQGLVACLWTASLLLVLAALLSLRLPEVQGALRMRAGDGD